MLSNLSKLILCVIIIQNSIFSMETKSNKEKITATKKIKNVLMIATPLIVVGAILINLFTRKSKSNSSFIQLDDGSFLYAPRASQIQGLKNGFTSYGTDL